MTHRIQILDIQVDALKLPEAMRRIDELIASRRFSYIVTPNPEFALEAQKDLAFRTWVNEADLALPDGVGLLWAAYFKSAHWPKNIFLRRLFGFFWLPISGLTIIFNPNKLRRIIPERLSGSDFTIEIAKLAAQRGYKLFLLGGREGVAQEAADYLKALYPNIPIADAIAGPPFHSEEVTQELLKNSQPQIVLLALPQKEQMAWTYRVQKLLPECCVMGVGGSLDFIIGASAYQDPTGKYKAVRAPFWMRRRGLEWLWRLFTQPWRYRRIFSAVVKFVNEVVREGR